jgi:hypothetical protein
MRGVVPEKSISKAQLISPAPVRVVEVGGLGERVALRRDSG